MNKKTFLLSALCMGAVTMSAQRIDLDQNNANKTAVEEPGYQHWTTGRTADDISKEFETEDGGTITITMSTGGVANRCIAGDWWKQGCQQYSKLICDGFIVYGYDGSNAPRLTNEDAYLYMTVSGLTPGRHTLLAYMNNTDGLTPSAPIDIMVNGKTVLENIEITNRAQTTYDCGQAYFSFEATEGQDVKITFHSKAGGKTWGTSGIYVNALLFDCENPLFQISNPTPENRDYHYNCDNGSAHLSWTMAGKAVKNHVYFGTSKDNLTKIATTTTGSYTVDNVSNLNTYFWRIDEEDAQGNIYDGDVLTFRPRHLAFPGAEGHGRFAGGGRGGSVYHVTTIEDNGDDNNPIPGSFRYAIKKATGPRTIVFDVAGTIYLKARLTCSDSYVTIAGQTAPGNGVLFRGAPIGISSENVMRFIRMRRGFHNDDEADMNRGLDGLGINGDHAIMDHCSMAWTIDEAHSSRNSRNITFQNNFISEALNDAHHPNYDWGAKHGFAATIGGDISSYHHNLLAHNEGRNWSMAGGLDGGGSYAGRIDMFNNVCYNWGGRATDGGVHEGQFVNNYYIMGPATSQKYLLNAQIEGTGKGSQAYYVNGNIREEKNGTRTQDKQNETYKYTLSGGQVLDWDVFVSTPFFDSEATIDPARLAYKKVLSNSGVNYDGLDEHDTRVLNDVLKRTTTYKGSSTGKAGLIDRETDAEGYVATWYPEEQRAADYDTDQDGMPDWWEKVNSLNPNAADNNSDTDGDGYTALEDYLNWMAEPHYTALSGAKTTIDLTKIFAGFNKSPQFTITSSASDCNASINGTDLEVSPTGAERISSITVKATDSENVGDMSRVINLYITPEASGIQSPITIGSADATYSVYATNGTLVRNSNDLNGLASGVYILKATDGKNTSTFKIVKK